MAYYSECNAFCLELTGLVDEKSPIWVKHAIRRWKQFYYEIQYTDGQVDTSNPLSTIFRNESLSAKLSAKSSEDTALSSALIPSKKEKSPPAQPQKTPPSKTEKRQSKGRFLFKLKEIQWLLNPLNLF